MIGRMFGGMSLFIGIFGLYKFLLPGYWEYTLQRPGLYAELPFTSIAVNVNDPTVSMAINTAMIVVGLYMLLNVSNRYRPGVDVRYEQRI